MGELKMPSRWKQDFPVPSGEDSYVTRREFTKFLGLTSLAFLIGTCAAVRPKAGEAVLSATNRRRSQSQIFTRFLSAGTSCSDIQRKTIPAFCCVLPRTSSSPSTSDARICPARCSSMPRRNNSSAPATKASSARKTDDRLRVRPSGRLLNFRSRQRTRGCWSAIRRR